MLTGLQEGGHGCGSGWGSCFLTVKGGAHFNLSFSFYSVRVDGSYIQGIFPTRLSLSRNALTNTPKGGLTSALVQSNLQSKLAIIATEKAT